MGSEMGPAYALGRVPEMNVVSVSASEKLTRKWSLMVRNHVASPQYGMVFPGTRLMRDAQGRDEWLTTEGGGYAALGTGSQFLGRGADLLIIDDPYPTFRAAQNETLREDVWEWYSDTAVHRLEPGGRIIIINHRMAEDDLCGKLIEAEENGTGEKWEKIIFPAITEFGALWEERYPLFRLKQLSRIMSPLAFSALFQQSPTPPSGKFYKKEWVQYFHVEPEALPPMRIFGASDYAVTDTEGLTSKKRDFTEHGIFGLTARRDLYLLDWWYGQTDADVWVRKQVDLMEKWKPFMWFGESGTIAKATNSILKQEMFTRGQFIQVEYLPSIVDKVTRSTAIQGMLSNLKVKFPANAPWSKRLIEQMMKFPSTVDDACDVMSLAGRGAAMVPLPGEVEQTPSERSKAAADHLNELARKQPTLDELTRDALLGADETDLLDLI